MRAKSCQSHVYVYSILSCILVSIMAAPSIVFAGGGARDFTNVPASPASTPTPLYSPTINTNLTSYTEGDNVVIGGKYFPPNTIVFLKIAHVDGVCTCSAPVHHSWAVATNTIGSFATSWHINLNLPANTTLVLKAIGTAGDFAATKFAANLTGAIWTTDQCGADVNGNIYGSCEPPNPLVCIPKSPFLNGGPHNQNCGAAGGLPDGDFYFQVTDPSGAVLLSSDGVEKRQFHVECGVITEYANLPGSVASHVLGTGFCPTHDSCPASIGIALWPFDPTPNPGGEYKCWVTRVADYDLSNPQANFGFLESESKTDNYKCAQSTGTGACCTSCASDSNIYSECVDNVTEAECLIMKGQFHPGAICDQQPCETCIATVTGACCTMCTNDPTVYSECVDNVTEAECLESKGQFHLGATCDEQPCETCIAGGCVLACGDDRNLHCNPDPDTYACHPESVTVDGCINGQVQCTPGSIQSNGCQRSRTNTYQATGCDGLPCECSQSLTWTEDTDPPVFTGCDDVTVNAEAGSCCAHVSFSVTADDECDGPLSAHCDFNSGECFPVGSTLVTCSATDICSNPGSCSFTINVRGSICGKKFYDANLDGNDNDGQVVAGWLIQLKDSTSTVIGATFTAADGTYCFNVLPGDYTVCEVLPPNSNWVASTPLCVNVQITAQNCRATANFGNYCTFSTNNGKTLGFWSNNNGKAVLQAHDPAWRTLLNGFCLRNIDGSNYDVPIPPVAFATARADFRSWLLGANATNMARMLSTQMAATRLDIEYMGVNASDNVILPANLAACYGAPIANIGAVIAAANAALCADGNTPSGDPNRAPQECLKDICDKINNNALLIISGDPCDVIYP